MTLSRGSLDELLHVLAGPGKRSVLAGAACSSVTPTDIPAARPWKQLLLRGIAVATGGVLSEVEADSLGDAPGVGLEAILGALDRQVSGLGARMVAPLVGPAAPPPNVIHELIAAQVACNSDVTVLTTNFDLCFERAIAAAGGSPRPWIAGTAPDPLTNVLKLHGCASAPQSLRHTFERIDRGFTVSDRAAIRSRAESKLIVVGYFGADPDVLDAISVGDTVWWLCLPGDVDRPRHGARRLARTRDVRFVEATFDELLAAAHRAPAPMGAGTWLEPMTRGLLVGAPTSDLLVALAEVSFRRAISDASWRPTDARIVAALQASTGGSPRIETHLAIGRRARFVGGPWSGPRVASRHFLAAARLCGDPDRAVHESDAADAREMIGWGLVRPLRAWMWRIHAGSMRRVHRGNLRAQIMFRAARSALHAGRPALAVKLLTRVLAERDGDMFLAAIAWRWRALALAHLGKPDWEADIRAAEELIRFEDRRQELADLQRTEACCLLLSRADVRRARALLRESCVSYKARRERRGWIRSRLAVFATFLGPVGLRFVRFFLP